MFYENDTLLVVDCVLDDDLGKRPYNNASLKFFSMPNMLPTGGGAMHRSWGLWAHCKFLTEQRVILVDAFVTVIQDFGVEGHPVTEYTSPSKYRNMYVAVSPPSPVRLFAVSSDCGTICIYKTADTKPVVICKGNGKSAHGLNWLAYNQSAMAMSMTILAVVCWYGSVLIFDIMTGEQLHASCPPISRPLPEHFSEMGALVDEHGWWPRVRNIFLHPYRPRGLIDHHYAATAFNLEFCWDYDELLPVYDPFGHLSGWKRRFW
jgi:WD40 repeat protein